MRQLVCLLRVINESKQVAFYERTSSYACVQGVKLPSYAEFFGLSSEEATNSAFDEKTDKFLEAKALELLEQRKKEAERNGGR